jgi:hypothetical protein
MSSLCTRLVWACDYLQSRGFVADLVVDGELSAVEVLLTLSGGVRVPVVIRSLLEAHLFADRFGVASVV